MSNAVRAKISILQRCGCRDKISWSRTGVIAYVPSDNHYRVCLAHVYLDKCNSWRIDASSTIPNLSTIHRDIPIVHISWSSNGTDLACLDAHGEVSIFTNSSTGSMSCLFHPSSSALATVDVGSSSELNHIVGFKWLELEKPILVAIPATKSDNPSARPSYGQYGIGQALPAGPFHPIPSKQACVTVSKRGLVRLIFQSPTDARFHQAVSNLNLTDPRDYISHATWRGYRDSLSGATNNSNTNNKNSTNTNNNSNNVNDKNTLMLITYAPASLTVSVYRVRLLWGFSKETPLPNGPNQPPQARIRIDLLLSEPLVPSSIPQGLALTHLVAYPSVPQKVINTEDEKQIELCMVFGSDKNSVMFMYSIQTQSVSLHSSLYALSTRRDSYTEEPEVQLVLKETLEANKSSPIISLSLTSFDFFCCSAFADGDITLRYRAPSHMRNPITCPQDIGFTFETNDLNEHDISSQGTIVNSASNGPVSVVPGSAANVTTTVVISNNNKDPNGTADFNSVLAAADSAHGTSQSHTPVIDIFVSPSLCAYAYLTPTGISIRKVHSPNPEFYANNDNLASSAIALASRHAAMCFPPVACEEILSLMASELSSAAELDKDRNTIGGADSSFDSSFGDSFSSGNNPNDATESVGQKLLFSLLHESHRAVNFSLHIAKDTNIEKLLTHPCLHRLLSMQLVLGTTGPNYKRNTMGQIAWTTLNIRLTAFALLFVIKSCTQPKQNLTVKVNQLMSLTGLVRWCTDLVAYLCQELYVASLSGVQFWYGSSPKSAAGNSSVVGAIVCGAIPRSFLIYVIRFIRQLEPVTENLCQEEMKAGVNGASAGSDGSTVTAVHVLKHIRETLAKAPVPLGLFEKLLRDTEAAMQRVTIPDRLGCEQKLIFEGKPPVELGPVLSRILEMYRSTITPSVNISRLYFYDVSWLGLDTYTPDVDVIRKVLVDNFTDARRRRRCSRCGGRSVWDDVKSLSSTNWTMVFQKNCFCGGNWF